MHNATAEEHFRRFNYANKSFSGFFFVDKATEFEGEKQHGRNLFDCRRCSVGALRRSENENARNKQRAKIYRYSLELALGSGLGVALCRLALPPSTPRIHA
jgi:hypothetical protein